MIGITRLLCGTVTPSDALRYGRDSSKLPSHLLRFSKDRKPVVVWNMPDGAIFGVCTAMQRRKTGCLRGS